ncbi:MAG: hypothetical protein V3S46_05405, partial [Nitrospinota bacterium]
MTLGQAFFGGVQNFFSEWIYCLLQIIPFFVAFIVGAFVGELDGKKVGLKRHAVRLALIGIIPLVGYTLVFVSMGTYT